MRFNTTALVDTVVDSTLAARPLVVAIDGRSGVGKSTLAQDLAPQIDAVVIHGDDFFSGGVVVRNR